MHFIIKQLSFSQSSQSFKVRSSYIEQLRNLNILASHFLPAFLRLLRLDEGLSKAFKLDIWAVEEYHIECGLCNISILACVDVGLTLL